MDNIANILKEEYGHETINYNSCVYMNNGEDVLISFLKKYAPFHRAVEIGTYQGVSTSIIAQYSDRVFTYDIIDLELKEKIWSSLDIKNIDYFLVESEDEKKKHIREILSGDGVTIAFIDGEHFHGFPQSDFEIVDGYTDYILIHDYNKTFPEVVELCDNVKGYKKEIQGDFCMLIKEKDNGI